MHLNWRCVALLLTTVSATITVGHTFTTCQAAMAEPGQLSEVLNFEGKQYILFKPTGVID